MTVVDAVQLPVVNHIGEACCDIHKNSSTSSMPGRPKSLGTPLLHPFRDTVTATFFASNRLWSLCLTWPQASTFLPVKQQALL